MRQRRATRATAAATTAATAAATAAATTAVLGNPATMEKIALLLGPRNRAHLAASSKLTRDALGADRIVRRPYMHASGNLFAGVMLAAKQRRQFEGEMRQMVMFTFKTPFPINMVLAMVYRPAANELEVIRTVQANWPFDMGSPRLKRRYRAMIRRARQDINATLPVDRRLGLSELQTFVETQKHVFRGYAMSMRVHEVDDRIRPIRALEPVVARPLRFVNNGPHTEYSTKFFRQNAMGWAMSTKRRAANRATASSRGGPAPRLKVVRKVVARKSAPRR